MRSNTKGDLSYNYAIDTERFKHTSLQMVVGSNVDILFHAFFADVIVEDGAVTGVVCETKSGRQAIYGRIVIDATGDGDVAFRAGVPYWQTKADEASRLNDCLMYKIAGFPEDTTAKGCIIGRTMVVWGPSPGAHNGADARELTEEEIDVRLAVYDDLEEKKRDAGGQLDGAAVIDTGALIGVRQTRFVEGEYRITGEDVLEGREFDDAVAMAHVFAIGEAAGVAGARCCTTDRTPRTLDVERLQATLIEQGCEIGQGKRR